MTRSRRMAIPGKMGSDDEGVISLFGVKINYRLKVSPRGLFFVVRQRVYWRQFPLTVC